MSDLKRFSLKIEKIDRRSDYLTIYFKQPSLKKYLYQAGQYLTLNVTINSRKYSRAYSLSSSPSLDKTLNITIKKVNGGVVSNFLFDNAKDGDILEVNEAAGDFIFNFESPASELFLWGAGSGITPLFSIINEVLYRGTEVTISLIYCNSNLQNAIFFDELLLLQKNYPNRLKLFFFFSREGNLNLDFKNYGRIDNKFIQSYLEGTSKCINETIHYICGPTTLKNLIIGQLHEKGISKTNILFED
jgi:ring-1,2-phenylacetyl-CoA epoxidase subunit PaaE